MIAQRFALALGYEDLNDHETMRKASALLAVIKKYERSAIVRRTKEMPQKNRKKDSKDDKSIRHAKCVSYEFFGIRNVPARCS